MEPREIVYGTGKRGSTGADAERFRRELRELRAEAGLNPADLAARAHYPSHVIVAAEIGPSLPDLPVLSAYVRGCGGALTEWEERWRSLADCPAEGVGLPARPVGISSAADAGARVGAVMATTDTPDADRDRIMAAITRASAATATTAGTGVTGLETTTELDSKRKQAAGAQWHVPPQWEASATLDAQALPDAQATPGAVLAASGRSAGARTVSGARAVPVARVSDGWSRLSSLSSASPPRAGTRPQRTALTAVATLVAAVMCLIAALLMVLR